MSEIKTVSTDKAAQPAAHYSQAKLLPASSQLLYLSGQIPATPSGEILKDTPIETQTATAIANLKAILEEAGSSLDKVVKCNIFLSGMEHFKGMNEEYAKHFPHKPARTALAVKGLPLGVDIEIEAVAVI